MGDRVEGLDWLSENVCFVIYVVIGIFLGGIFCFVDWGLIMRIYFE